MPAPKLARAASSALCLTFAAGLLSAAQAVAPDPATLKKIAALSVPFVPNAGQWDARAAFAAQTFAGTLFVTKQGELVYNLPGKPEAPPIDANEAVDLKSSYKERLAATSVRVGLRVAASLS